MKQLAVKNMAKQIAAQMCKTTLGFRFTARGFSMWFISVGNHVVGNIASVVHVYPVNGGKDHNAFHPLTVYNGFSKSWCTGHDRTAPLICRLLYRLEMFRT